MKPRTQIATVLAALFVLVPKVHSVLYGTELSGAPKDSPRKTTQAKPDSGTSQGPAAIPVVLPQGKKLILTDGTFQLAREYSVQGDRVRYWSVERSDWEEIPAKLVDWDATHKAESEQVAQDAELKAKIHASEVAERTKDINIDRSLEIKPGLFLPDGVGFYALETKQIYEMKQSQAVAPMSKARETERILTGVPFISKKETLEIPDTHAALQLETAEPEFFMRPTDEREPRFRLLRAQIKDGHRVLENIIIHFTGQQTEKATDIEFQTWTPAPGVFRYTMDQRLEPGEYAFVEMTSEGVSGYVWDFGIDAPSTKRSK
jgi:hypothetical protein